MLTFHKVFFIFLNNNEGMQLHENIQSLYNRNNNAKETKERRDDFVLDIDQFFIIIYCIIKVL